ncbi:MAG: PilZ domain-containing protein [Gammaproteobacteria bacterium]|nr:PilZ domain-containing protein [Gammaproteobacteria bacterium]
MNAINGGARNAILSVKLQDEALLYAAYMPFVKNGGLFISTEKSYHLGSEVFLLLTLMDEPEKLPIVGKVIWITPERAQGNRTPGIGVQFNDKDNLVQGKIEVYLAGVLGSSRPTNTL